MYELPTQGRSVRIWPTRKLGLYQLLTSFCRHLPENQAGQ